MCTETITDIARTLASHGPVADIDACADDIAEAMAMAIVADEEEDAGHLARLAILLGCEITVDSDDIDEEEYGDPSEYRGSAIEATQTHRLCVDGHEAAKITREGISYHGAIDHPNTPGGEWTTDSSEADEAPNAAWEAVCQAAGLSGDWECPPCADEPPEVAPQTDPDGPYCLWWQTVGDDGGPLSRGDRYPTIEDAMIARDAAEHELHLRNRGRLLCGYAIGELVEGEWQLLYGDD